MKEKIIEIFLREFGFSAPKVADEILALFKPNTLEELQKMDPEKFSNVFPGPVYTNEVFAKGHWGQDDAGYAVWIDEEKI